MLNYEWFLVLIFPLRKQYAILAGRTWVATSRDAPIMYVRTGAAIGIGLLVGIVFYQRPDDPSGASARINTLLFLMCVFSMFPVPAIARFISDSM